MFLIIIIYFFLCFVCLLEQSKSNETEVVAACIPGPSTTAEKSYVFIDHEKTTTLKELAKERLQNHPRRVEA